jgi:hypothetical protein
MPDSFSSSSSSPGWSRREFLAGLARIGVACTILPSYLAQGAQTPAGLPESVLTFPGPWSFNLPKAGLILVNDQQLDDLQDPDKEVDVSLSATPNRITLRRFCAQQQAAGVRTIILAFDHFFAQYRQGQGEKVRQYMPDTDVYIQRVQRISQTLKEYGLGLELSLLSPLELGPGYRKQTGGHGRWIQYREGVRDPKTGFYDVQLWEHQRWTNNKGTIDVRRDGVRVFAFKEQRVGGTAFYAVNPAEIVELKEKPELREWEGASADVGGSFSARRLSISGRGDTQAAGLNRVLVVVSYDTPELDYFSPQAEPFLKDLVQRYHKAGVPLNGLYSDEMHIQQDWVYSGHHDEGQFTLRYLTQAMAEAYATAYGAEYKDFEKYLVYFCYGQHGFVSNLEARLGSQHVLDASPEGIQRTFLLRRRYYDLLDRTVIGLFTGAREYAESLYGHALEARAHATWAQSPTIDFWDRGNQPHAPKQYEYTPDFLWSNTIQQSAAACADYFRWNDFLTGGGNDHAEGGWSDRDYYALALACSTGILNRVPYAYAAHWGMPAAASERRQALVDAYGTSAQPSFQAIENSEHRDVEVLMLYPLSLVACEERFGSWMTQYGYANYVTAERLLSAGKVTPDGRIAMAGRSFSTLATLFEPLPPAGLLDFLEDFVNKGGRLIWSGPPPRLDMGGASILERWQKLAGVEHLDFAQEGISAPGEIVEFEGALQSVPKQTILTAFLVDRVYPVAPQKEAGVLARVDGKIAGVLHKTAQGGTVVYLGFRPRDDQAASLGYETRTWFEILNALGAYPRTRENVPAQDNPSVLSRTNPWLACRFPNGTVTVAAHYNRHVESWPGGFLRNAKEDETILAGHPLPSDRLDLNAVWINGWKISYQGRLLVAFRPGDGNSLLAFGGYNCERIAINDREHRFADKPMAHLAWAPVAANRRVPGGARMEIWAVGDGAIRIPLVTEDLKGKLFFAGGKPGSLGGEVPAEVRDGVLCFESKASWPQKHLYWVEMNG